jgi:hypothetical protein
MSFEKNVFVNCPFDDEYYPILRAILFTLIYLEFTPKITETSDSGQSRLSKIKDLIESSKYSIHDISRVQPNKEGLPRFNMPFECGIDFGAKMYGVPRLEDKKCLILEKERYRYQKFLSDIAGNDIRAHSDDPAVAIKQVRNWLKINSGDKLDWPTEIWNVFRVPPKTIFCVNNNFVKMV